MCEVNHSTRQHQGMDATPQHSACLLPWRPVLRLTMGRQRLYFVCVNEVLCWSYVCVTLCYKRSYVLRAILPLCMLTFVVGGVVDAEISIPDDCQLHGKTAHLHPIIKILSPRQPKWKWKRVREKVKLHHFKLFVFKSKGLWQQSTSRQTQQRPFKDLITFHLLL